MTKKCPNCGLENNDVSRFCKNCGTSLNTQNKSNSNKNILIIAVAAIICVAVIAGSIVYLNSDGNFNLFGEPIHIVNTTFTTGHSLSDKTTCVINVGTDHAGEEVTVSVLYSRDGTNLNDGDKSAKTISESGEIVCESQESYNKYPDRAIVTIYDSKGNVLDSADITLATDDSTQVAIGNGTITAKSITVAEHSASTSSNSGEWVEDIDLSEKAGYDCHIYVYHHSDGTKSWTDDDGYHTAPESEELVF